MDRIEWQMILTTLRSKDASLKNMNDDLIGQSICKIHTDNETTFRLLRDPAAIHENEIPNPNIGNRSLSAENDTNVKRNNQITAEMTKKFRMYYQNVRGLRSKKKYKAFKLSAAKCDYDILALTETGLNSAVYDGELITNNKFCLYRCDRSHLNSEHDRLGGVMVAVRSEIPSERVDIPSVSDLELVLVNRLDLSFTFTNGSLKHWELFLTL
ncbi:hypothetical protein Bhyg_08089 [Pseudolycoriella hygida]|uniref:Uncharacterized protein n=1 Tax=Pseudolycoriella hygida TaxID=35572 RepID=A0A9Q0N3V0_9DIPT|nr:hypothetical protein Bhyg_08089 [Pseudolycoriella hygida]